MTYLCSDCTKRYTFHDQPMRMVTPEETKYETCTLCKRYRARYSIPETTIFRRHSKWNFEMSREELIEALSVMAPVYFGKVVPNDGDKSFERQADT